MNDYHLQVVNGLICDKVAGELDAALAFRWVDELEKLEHEAESPMNRFHDVRNVDAVHLCFNDLWDIAQRRLASYKEGDETVAAFWVSNPLNYGVSRMYQALTDGTPFKIEVFYKLEDVADFLGVSTKMLEEISA